MKILVTGSQGQIGTELCRQSDALGWAVLGVDRDVLNIADASAVEAAVGAYQPDAVINAAAYTAVDDAEDNSELAFAANRVGPACLARVCAEKDIPLVHISTDYVFDGRKVGGYVESDTTGPASVYGASKLAGEEEVRRLCLRHYILRTSWVFSAHGNNFVKTMLRLGKERATLGVVADQRGKPTSAREISTAILAMLASSLDAWGTYHFAQTEEISWHGFAEGIFTEAQRQNVPLAVKDLRAIETKDYPTVASRPANSTLDCSRFEQTFDMAIKPWRESLVEVIKELNHG